MRYSPLSIKKIASWLSCGILACSVVLAQAHKEPADSAKHAADTQRARTVKGCLDGGAGPDQFELTSVDDGQIYKLTGNTSGFRTYLHKEITVDGEADLSTEPWPSFQVISIKQVFNTPLPSLTSSFSNLSNWHRETNQDYGIQFAHPEDFTARDPQSVMLRPNFADTQNVVTVSSLEIPRDAYPHTNFVGGAFGIFVSPEINNAQSCSEFEDTDARFHSSYRIGGIEYAKWAAGGGAAGTFYERQLFHTFQNGLCYEIAFRFAEYNTGLEDTGCTVPVIRREDEQKLIDPLLAALSFTHPTIVVAKENNSGAVPRVTRFDASFGTDDSRRNRGQVTLSWSMEGADYVELSYLCVPAPGEPGVVISEDHSQRSCENADRRIHSNMILNHSPNASANVDIGNFQRDRMSVIVSVTPFSHGVPYPDSRKSITLQVDPYALPRRAPARR